MLTLLCSLHFHSTYPRSGLHLLPRMGPIASYPVLIILSSFQLERYWMDASGAVTPHLTVLQWLFVPFLADIITIICPLPASPALLSLSEELLLVPLPTPIIRYMAQKQLFSCIWMTDMFLCCLLTYYYNILTVTDKHLTPTYSANPILNTTLTV